MPIDMVGMVADSLLEMITRRILARDSNRQITASEGKKIYAIADEISRMEVAPDSVIRAFIDHVMPMHRKFKSIRNIRYEWNTFTAESLGELVPVMPVQEIDDDRFRLFQDDWRCLADNVMYYGSVYLASSKVKQLKFEKIHRLSQDFWRLLIVWRKYQDELSSKYPLFTVRSFLAAQIETLNFIDRMKIGNLVSEKAFDRYEDWYCRKFYTKELVEKARKRPSANNPVSTPEARLDYEKQRMATNVFVGDVSMGGESVPFFNRPRIYDEQTVKAKPEAKTSITVPPILRD